MAFRFVSSIRGIVTGGVGFSIWLPGSPLVVLSVGRPFSFCPLFERVTGISIKVAVYIRCYNVIHACDPFSNTPLS